MIGEWDFVPLYEVGARVFLFQFKQDRDKAVIHFETTSPNSNKRKERRARRKRKPRAPR